MIAAVQERLVEVGLLPEGAADGSDGPRTRSAIEEYRRVSGARVSDEPDATLRAALDETLAGWRGQGVDERWAVVATSSGPAHGAASGRDRLQAHVEAKRSCAAAGGEDCLPVRTFPIDEMERCTALVVEIGGGPKHLGFAVADSLTNANTRQIAMANAMKACGDGMCVEGVSYCTADFR